MVATCYKPSVGWPKWGFTILLTATDQSACIPAWIAPGAVTTTVVPVTSAPAVALTGPSSTSLPAQSTSTTLRYLVSSSANPVLVTVAATPGTVTCRTPTATGAFHLLACTCTQQTWCELSWHTAVVLACYTSCQVPPPTALSSATQYISCLTCAGAHKEWPQSLHRTTDVCCAATTCNILAVAANTYVTVSCTCTSACPTFQVTTTATASVNGCSKSSKIYTTVYAGHH